MPSQQQFKTQTSKIPYEGPTRYEILHLIIRYNAAHHDLDHIKAVGLTDIDKAAVESFITLDQERLFQHNPLDAELDLLIRDIQQVKQISTYKDCNRINWERLMEGTKTLKMMKQVTQDRGFDGLAKYAGVDLDQRKRANKRDSEKQLVKKKSNAELNKRVQAEAQMLPARGLGGKQIRKTQSHAEIRTPKRYEDDATRQDGLFMWRNNDEVRKRGGKSGFSDRDFGMPVWMFPKCAEEDYFTKKRAKGRSPSPVPRPAQPEAKRDDGRPTTPGPAKLQKPNHKVPIPTNGTAYQIEGHLAVPNDHIRAKSPVHYQQRPKNPSPPQRVKSNVLAPKRSTVFQQQVKTYVPGPTKHTVYQLPAKPPAALYHQQARENAPRPKSPAPQQYIRLNTLGNLNRPKSNANLRQTAAVNDPTKDPGNKAMYNKRPRVVTEIKDLRMQKAHEEAIRLVSEIRKMD
ncbi:hypothetical protein V8E51_004830 [Hyaloscypha variabilis]